MAVTIDVAELAAAMRLGSTTEETAQAMRLLTYSTEAVLKYAPNATDTSHNEAVIRLAAYMYDQPHVGRGAAFANAMRNSGAARILLPYRVHRLGLADDDDETSTSTTGAGFAPTLVGMGMVDARTQVAVWLDSGVSTPTTSFFGIQVTGPRATDGISIFPNELRGDVPVVMGASATAVLGERDFAIAVLAGGTVAVAFQQSGTYAVAIYELGDS